MNRWIDAHCHPDRYPDPIRLLERAEQTETGILAVSMNPSGFLKTRRLAAGYPRVLPAVGLHPVLAQELEHELELVEAGIAETRFIGEVGLDYSVKEKAAQMVQRRVFEQIVDMAKARGDAVMSIHGRRAWEDILGSFGAQLGCTAILHWYSGSGKLLEKALSLGCCFSFNPAGMEGSQTRDYLKMIPLDRILTETDGPYVQVGGIPAGPETLPKLVAWIADCKEVDPEEMRVEIMNNWNRIILSQSQPAVER